MYRILFHPTTLRQLRIGVLTVVSKAFQLSEVVAGGVMGHRLAEGIPRLTA